MLKMFYFIQTIYENTSLLFKTSKTLLIVYNEYVYNYFGARRAGKLIFIKLTIFVKK